MAKKIYEMKEMTIEQMENFASENNLKVKDTDDETRYDLYDGRKKMYEVTIVEEAKKSRYTLEQVRHSKLGLEKIAKV